MTTAPITTPSPPQEYRRLRMSYEDLQAWASEDIHAEWVNGEVIVQMPPKSEHPYLVAFLIELLNPFIRLFNLGRLLAIPFEMRATPDGPAREPDVLFVAAENPSRLTRERLNGPADLVIEIVSDDSVYRDRVDKFDEYEAAGVREYWIIDPRPGGRGQRADFWVLDEKGRYRAGQITEGIYRSTVLMGFWLRLDWLLAETLPDPLTALAQIVGPEKIAEMLAQTSRNE